MDTRANKEHWDQLGGRYSLGWASPSQHELSRKEREFVVRHVPARSGNAVLDIGIGNGRILAALLMAPNVSDVYGIDIAPSMLEFCRERLGDNPKVRQLTLCDIATEQLPVDVALQFISAVRVLKYMPNWWDVVRDKLIAQLAPGGVLVFSMPNRHSVKRFSRPYAVQYEMTTEARLRRRLNEAGTDVLEIAGFSKFPDLLHRRSKRKWSSKLIVATDDALRRPLGQARFATELFVAVRRP
jgi:SAM-dependent methyltransferase